METKIVKTQAQAVKFAQGGGIHTQRAAYFAHAGKAYRAERLPGEHFCRAVEEADGLWYDEGVTLRQALGLDPMPASAERLTPSSMGRRGGLARSAAMSAADRSASAKAAATARWAKKARNWYVCNDRGDVSGHDMDEASAKENAAEMNEREPGANYEALRAD
jgi:hypothetical protein